MDALAQRPNLDTVTEESEEEANGKDKTGQTELHKLAAQQGECQRERERERERERLSNYGLIKTAYQHLEYAPLPSLKDE